MISGICKDCGNGTLNNDRVRAFIERDLQGSANEGFTVLCCRACGSYHLDILDTGGED